tara:strand:+ start:31943 stop:33610 length:1668 start_codon:yes stop_codon:yes gene_type:complete
MNFFIFIITISCNLIFSESLTTQESVTSLFGNGERVHATPHITNLIRNGPDNLSKQQLIKLQSLGMHEEKGEFLINRPQGLDETHLTEHFKLHFTRNNSNDAVQNIDYVINMGIIFEEVWDFFSDSMGFDFPPTDLEDTGSYQYDIYIVNLPIGYFGLTYTSNASIDDASCSSFIKMRNSYNYPEFVDHTELDNIRVTAVHEFFHAIQFGYNCFERLWFMESTAVWAEDELYDNINDMYRYMPSWFASIEKPIDSEDTHMYGSFIYFQYIDEHLGGKETIKNCWEESRKNADPDQDISFQSIDEALKPHGSSFKHSYNNMRIANRVMSNDVNASIYRYEEATDYPVTQPAIKNKLAYLENNFEFSLNYSLRPLSTHYYDFYTESPVIIKLLPSNNNQEDFNFTIIIKHKTENRWTIKSGKELNIDPSIGIDYVTIIVSSLNYYDTNFSYTFNLSDGYEEDFIISDPYPNPVFDHNPLKFDLQVISPQNIKIDIFNLLGQNIISKEHNYFKPSYEIKEWNLKNRNGKKIPDGVYFIKIKGQRKLELKKFTYFKFSK